MAETTDRHLERMVDATRPTGATAFKQPGERVAGTGPIFLAPYDALGLHRFHHPKRDRQTLDRRSWGSGSLHHADLITPRSTPSCP
jgi:hypothetical protein